MTDKEHNAERAAMKTLNEIYRVAKSIEEKVEDILEEIGECVRARSGDYRSYYPPDGLLEEY